MKSDVFQWLQNWYQSQTNGDWEHEYGVKIDTLDNPGWSLSIDLAKTALEGKPLEPLKIERSEHDWLCCRVENNVFMADCGPKNLTEVIEVFRDWHNVNCWESVKRFERTGDPHYNKSTKQDVPTPHVHDPQTPGKVRPARPDETPK